MYDNKRLIKAAYCPTQYPAMSDGACLTDEALFLLDRQVNQVILGVKPMTAFPERDKNIKDQRNAIFTKISYTPSEKTNTTFSKPQTVPRQSAGGGCIEHLTSFDSASVSDSVQADYLCNLFWHMTCNMTVCLVCTWEVYLRFIAENNFIRFYTHP